MKRRSLAKLGGKKRRRGTSCSSLHSELFDIERKSLTGTRRAEKEEEI